MVAGLVAAPLVRWIDDRTRWTLMEFGTEGARTVVGALASSLLTFIVFAFSILLLAVQMASGQLSPRIIARVFEDRLTKLTIGAFVFTWVYTLAAAGRIEERVPQLSIVLAILLSLASVGLFFHLVQRASESLRPVKTLTDVAHDTRAVIESVYPGKFSDTGRGPSGATRVSTAAVRTIAHRGRSGVVLAFDVQALASIAAETDCTIELVPMAGDFLATDENLFRLYGKGATAVDAEILFDRVALGSERTLSQDPAFGFRIIVDIASKALSAAVNDPTTAVLAIDQLHHLLHLLCQRQLDTGVVRDASGQTRLVYRTPDWEDFVTLAVTEIRIYGAQSPQATRRLQAMLEGLLPSVPAERRAALDEQIAALRRTVNAAYLDPHDRAIAIQGDLQGFGGAEQTVEK
jgi:uncharacterized membrane protein